MTMAGKTIRVAALQFGAGENAEDNLKTCLRLIDEAAAAGAQLMVTPEFANHCSWYQDQEHCYRVAVPLDGPFVAAIAAKAREHHCHIVVNCTVRRRNNAITGTNLLFGPNGTLLATSDKQVLMGNENNFLGRAKELSPVVATPLGRLGMYSCMDGVINEPPRSLALRGAQVLCNSLNSFANDEASLHIPVRAAENKTFLVAANKSGPLVPAGMINAVADKLKIAPERLHGAGESQIVAPNGAVLARGPVFGEAVVIADIDVGQADDKRRPDGTDLFASRRPEIYGAIAAAPRPRAYQAKSSALPVAVVQPASAGQKSVVEAARAVAEAALAGARLIVLPELFFVAGRAVADVNLTERLSGEAELALASALEGSRALAAFSAVARDGAGKVRHDGVLVSADGVVLRQAQLHRAARHASWVESYGNHLATADLEWGRIAVIVGNDALYPETFRLAALQDVEVVAVPGTLLERWEADVGLIERAAENRLSIVMATRPSAAGTSMIVAPDRDFTLWTQWSRPFDGNINYPNVTRAPASAGTTTAIVDPSTAGNRTVTLKTDVVDGRPYWLLGPLVESR
jgi:predicted amidohydrolase